MQKNKDKINEKTENLETIIIESGVKMNMANKTKTKTKTKNETKKKKRNELNYLPMRSRLISTKRRKLH